jgi:hypothetical protein
MKQKRISSNIFVCLMVFLLMACSVYAANAVNLGTAGNFAILSKSGVTDVPTSTIIGDVGTSPITGAAIGVSCTEVTGTIYDDDGFYTGGYDSNTICKVTNAGLLTTAVSDMEAAYTSAAGPIPVADYILGGDISGMILTPGIYERAGGLLINSGTPPDVNGVTLDCGGNTGAVFIFRITGTLTVGSGAIVTLSNGCQAKNIFWAVAGVTTLGTTSVFNGDILSGPGVAVDEVIAINTGATLCGRALSQKAVTLDHNNISVICGNINEINTASLTVNKIVVNDDGGTAVVGDFTLLINGNSVLSGIANVVAPGSYVVSEIGVSGYNGTISGDCSPNGTVTLVMGQNKTCTITNNDIPSLPNSAKLTVTKIVINDDGGTKKVSNFTLKVGSVLVVSGVQNTFNASTYIVSEVLDPMYNRSFSGDCSINGTVLLHAGDVKTCIITNNDIRPKKTISVMGDELFILLTVFTLILGLYGFKKYVR